MSEATQQEERQSTENGDTRNVKQAFICGVIEGFYGKPWTSLQRKDLFRRLREMNLNTFMYAPKDDTKHRAKWRQLYDEFEVRELEALIREAELNGVEFYYSLSPGLDMIYSSEEEVNILKRKFDQLRSLGCKSFAILFDDIEPRIIDERDKPIFQNNYARAQVTVTNMIYEYLNKPNFFFCPTEYCESRAVPSVPESQYLNTIGAGLHPGIDIMWSGSRVISRYITEESIQQLSQVIRRPPLIWENLHANDYDKKRVFLGPYSGRSTKIIPMLRGVLTNPNCEYEANYIAIHTLAQWSRCTEDANPHNRCNQDTQMEAAINSVSGRPHCEPAAHVYDPDRALVRAIRDWLPLVLSSKSLPGGNDSLTREMRNDEAAEIQIVKEVGHNEDRQVKDIEVDPPFAQDDAKVLHSPDQYSESSEKTSDMDTSSSSPVQAASGATHAIRIITEPTNTALLVDSNSCDSCEMQDASSNDQKQALQPPTHDKQRDTQPIVDCIVCSANTNNNDPNTNKVDLDSLALLVDFFYLPFEHGLRGHALLSDIKWLIDNSGVFVAENQDEQQPGEGESRMNDEDEYTTETKTSAEITKRPAASGDNEKVLQLWIERAERMNNLCACVNRILSTLIHDCPNKLITAELYPYLAELRDVIIMITDYIKFLRHRQSRLDRFYFSSGPKRREQVAPCDEQEPWVHRGGLIGDMQRLIL